MKSSPRPSKRALSIVDRLFQFAAGGLWSTWGANPSVSGWVLGIVSRGHNASGGWAAPMPSGPVGPAPLIRRSRGCFVVVTIIIVFD